MTKTSLIVTGCAVFAVVVVAASSLRAAAPVPKPPPPAKANPLVTDVLEVFKTSCAECHGPEGQEKHKKAKFHYITDLSKLRANPKYVVPGKPEESSVYTQVAKDEMPPEDEGMALTAAQKDVIKKWIAGGAPAAAETRTPRPLKERVIAFIGRFHPLAAHTPIALLMAAAIAEIVYLRHPAPALSGAARFCVVLGAMGAVATAALGWAWAASSEVTRSAGLETHRWAGTIAGIATIPVAILGEWGARRAHHEGRKWHGMSRWAFRITVIGIAGLVGFTAHLGGILVWGPEIFDFPQF
jgi:uncharacterized membrane protein/mono/diheme cytochrome c family protein